MPDDDIIDWGPDVGAERMEENDSSTPAREITMEGDYTPDGRRRVLCKRCGWHATGRDEAKVRVRALRHVEGCGLCESHGKVCGEPYPMSGCTHVLCVQVRDAERTVLEAKGRQHRRAYAAAGAAVPA